MHVFSITHSQHPFFPPLVTFALLPHHGMNTTMPPCEDPKRESSGAACSDDSNSPAFFLDLFQKEVLENVVRFFSRLPKEKHWEAHIPLASIVELYGVTGELGKFMKPRFNTLCVSAYFDVVLDIQHYLWKKRRVPMLWTNDISSARRFVLAGGGQSLHTLIVGENMYAEGSGTEIVDDFLSICPNAKSLSVEEKDCSGYGGLEENLKNSNLYRMNLLSF